MKSLGRSVGGRRDSLGTPEPHDKRTLERGQPTAGRWYTPRMPPFRINEIFLSVQGEGVHAGERTVFVRFYGCPLRCVWCDQPEALAHTGVGRFTTLSADEVRDQVLGYPDVRRVCLTGGE